ncbi:transporter substrate-binding domain-containing protein [Pseudonocardia phyllosphaerae]|uniref:transporter substrate-binding domain-containing protein n=1 Tax=Pseudonocardia phyllosphaerae TaxID=3390502 RepID=UPI00397B3A01
MSRRRLLGAAAALGGATLAGPLLTGCGREASDPLTRLRSGGDLVIGLDGERPFGYIDGSGRPTGESPEVARAVARDLGGNGVLAVQTSFDQLIPELLQGRVDMVAVGLTITPLRCQQVTFSRPDYMSRSALVVREGNPLGVATLAGVARSGATLAVVSGGAEAEFAVAANIPPDRIQYVPDQTTLVNAVADGRAQVGALTRASLLAEVRAAAGSGVEVTTGFTPMIGGRPAIGAGGFAFRPSDTEFRDEFDRALTALHDSGRWLQITEPFGFTPDDVPPPGLTTAQLCARTAQP